MENFGDKNSIMHWHEGRISVFKDSLFYLPALTPRDPAGTGLNVQLTRKRNYEIKCFTKFDN